MSFPTDSKVGANCDPVAEKSSNSPSCGERAFGMSGSRVWKTEIRARVKDAPASNDKWGQSTLRKNIEHEIARKNQMRMAIPKDVVHLRAEADPRTHIESSGASDKRLGFVSEDKHSPGSFHIRGLLRS